MKDIDVKILSNKNITHTYYKIVFEAPYIAKFSRPGQFVMVRCGNGQEIFLRRPFSIHRVALESFEILYEVIGKGTAILSKKKRGEHLQVLGPLGNGFDLSYFKKGPVADAFLVGGGIGVAPLLFLAERLVRIGIKPVVFIGAREKDLILCEKDFRRIGAELHIATDDGSIGYKGSITDLFKGYIRELKNKKEGCLVYACGPEVMLDKIIRICKNKRIYCQVSLETLMACGFGACLGCAIETLHGTKLVCKDGPIFNIEELISLKSPDYEN